jgi:sugar (pentulose or hexulose) kinase
MSFLALDIGTSFIKGAVLNADTYQIDHIQRVPFPEPIPNLPPLFCEVEPYKIIDATRELIAQLAPHAPDCEGVVMCGQMQGLVLTDERATPLSNYISWRDQRALMPHANANGNTYLDSLMERVTSDERRQMGSELRASLPVCALYWLNEQKQLPRGAIPSSLSDFVISNLCGTTPTIEPTNASVHGVLNLETMDWQWSVIEKLGLGNLQFPKLQHAGEIGGYLDLNGRRVPCYTPLGDQPTALAGALLQEGELSINISTGSQVALLSPYLEFGKYQTRPFFDGKSLNIITHIPAGRALTALVNLFTEISPTDDAWDYIIRAVDGVRETDLCVNLAFFASACGDQGAIENMREENMTIGHVFFAAFVNMVQNYWACANRLSPQRKWNKIVFSGGLAQKIDLLRRLIVEKFDVPYRIAPSSEDTLLGLLLLARVFSGQTSTLQKAIEDFAKT